MKKPVKKFTAFAFVISGFLFLGSTASINVQPLSPSPSAIVTTEVTNQNLDFNSALGQETRVQNKKDSSTAIIWPLLIIAFMISAIVFSYFKGISPKWSSLTFNLFDLPMPAKLAITFLLIAYGLTHIFAALTVYFDTRVVYATSKEYFFYIKPGRLTALTHAHLMAIGTMNGITAFLYAMNLNSKTYAFSSAVVTMTFVGIFGDITSWWLTKYWGENFEILSMVTGIFFSLGFTIMALSVFRSLWFKHLSGAKVSI